MKPPAPGVVWKTFLNGLVVVLPVVVTAALIYWLGASLERALGAAIRLLVPEERYVPGLGIMAAVALTFAVGVATRLWLTRRLLVLGERLLEQIPLAKTIYGGARDLMRFVSSAADADGMDKVVLVDLADGVQLVGFVTDHEARFPLPEGDGDDEDRVPVYLQMSYQLGGYTVFVPRSRVTPLDMDLESAMRWVLTAGVSAGGRGERGGAAGTA